MPGVTGPGGASPMSCVREGSLEPPYRPPVALVQAHGEGRTGRFFRGLRRMFRRRASGGVARSEGRGEAADPSPEHKSCSTSELLEAERHSRRKEAFNSGLSVSHDSVFTGERSGDDSGDERTRAPRLPTDHQVELGAAVRRRRGRGRDSDDEEDLGLPRSPPASPPHDDHRKRHHAGISHSSCSDGSLLSVGSSEMDDDSSTSHHLEHHDAYSMCEPPPGVAPLSHSAARHKMAVRPRRTHPAPRRKKPQPSTTALPITPELNEDGMRSTTPDIAADLTDNTDSSNNRVTKESLVSEHHQEFSKELNKILEAVNESKTKSSSLPPGLALSQMTGHSHAKLAIVEGNTPRSSIKRSKSTSQDQNKEEIAKSEKDVHKCKSEVRISKYNKDSKQAENTCQEKKTKSEKKFENEIIKSSKKEESFFSRLLLRKSGKKSKKEQTDLECQQDSKKCKVEKTSGQYKIIDAEKYNPSHARQGAILSHTDKIHTSAGQRAFANPMHRRLDNKGAYIQEEVYKEAYAHKISRIDCGDMDLKSVDSKEKQCITEIKKRTSLRDDTNGKKDKSIRLSSRDIIGETKRQQFVFNHDKTKRPLSTRVVEDNFPRTRPDPVEKVHEKLLPKIVSLDETGSFSQFKNKQNDIYSYSTNKPMSIPYFKNHNMFKHSSPPKSLLNQSSEYMNNYHAFRHISEAKQRSINYDRETLFNDYKTENSYVDTALRSIGDDYIENRGSIGKSHSFRYASESTSTSSQDSQLPSLPTIVGISDPLLESWETNYRRNVNHKHDISKMSNAKKYDIFHTGTEMNYDSLQSTDTSYLDSLKTDTNEDLKLFTNNSNVAVVDIGKRESYISQIEAKIDDIISSPKPIMTPILKSNSLDSVRSSPEKYFDDRRKTMSVESSLSQDNKVKNDISQRETYKEVETYVSVTHVNKEPTPEKVFCNKTSKCEEKSKKVNTSTIPEFMKIQLNKVDVKPATNIILTANMMPKKNFTSLSNKENNVMMYNEKTKAEETVVKVCDDNKDYIENDKKSPVSCRKQVVQTTLPLSPSTPKPFFKRKSVSNETPEKIDKSRANSLSTEGSTEKIYDNISMDRKSHSSYGSKSSIQSTDSSEPKTFEKQEETVVFRRKRVSNKDKNDKVIDDEPELMKVFARRSLKIKDSDADNLTQEIAEKNKAEESVDNNAIANSKVLKNEFNASIKSRDSDKENEDKQFNDENRLVDIAARVSQFGAPHYQRSVSINSAMNQKRESAPVYRTDASKYKKEFSDSIPDKRLRNRTFPDSSNDREELKTLTKSETMPYKADTLSKRVWNRLKEEDKVESVVEKDQMCEMSNDKDDVKETTTKNEGESLADDSPQFKGILQMKAEWERRAKQGMNK